MTNIDRYNYEAWALDYIEGILAGAERERFERFLSDHPVLAREVAELKEAVPYLPEPLETMYPDKEKLRFAGRRESEKRLVAGGDASRKLISYLGGAVAAAVVLGIMILGNELFRRPVGVSTHDYLAVSRSAEPAAGIEAAARQEVLPTAEPITPAERPDVTEKVAPVEVKGLSMAVERNSVAERNRSIGKAEAGAKGQQDTPVIDKRVEFLMPDSGERVADATKEVSAPHRTELTDIRAHYPADERYADAGTENRTGHDESRHEPWREESSRVSSGDTAPDLGPKSSTYWTSVTHLDPGDVDAGGSKLGSVLRKGVSYLMVPLDVIPVEHFATNDHRGVEIASCIRITKRIHKD